MEIALLPYVTLICFLPRGVSANALFSTCTDRKVHHANDDPRPHLIHILLNVDLGWMVFQQILGSAICLLWWARPCKCSHSLRLSTRFPPQRLGCSSTERYPLPPLHQGALLFFLLKGCCFHFLPLPGRWSEPLYRCFRFAHSFTSHFRHLPHTLLCSLSLSSLTELANEVLESTSSVKAPRAHGYYAEAYG